MKCHRIVKNELYTLRCLILRLGLVNIDLKPICRVSILGMQHQTKTELHFMFSDRHHLEVIDLFTTLHLIF